MIYCVAQTGALRRSVQWRQSTGEIGKPNISHAHACVHPSSCRGGGEEREAQERGGRGKVRLEVKNFAGHRSSRSSLATAVFGRDGRGRGHLHGRTDRRTERMAREGEGLWLKSGVTVAR